MPELQPAPFDVLLEVAAEQNVIVTELPRELTGQVLKQETWIGEGHESLHERAARDLPAVLGGAVLNRTPVLFGVLPRSPLATPIRDSVRRYRNQAAIARSWLGVDAANLQLFLVSAVDDGADAGWYDAAALIESDDRICRKLVWLAPHGSVRESAAEFLARTFLAAPWRRPATVTPAPLDTLSAIELPPGWQQVIYDASLDPDSVVLKLSRDTPR